MEITTCVKYKLYKKGGYYGDLILFPKGTQTWLKIKKITFTLSIPLPLVHNTGYYLQMTDSLHRRLNVPISKLKKIGDYTYMSTGHMEIIFTNDDDAEFDGDCIRGIFDKYGHLIQAEVSIDMDSTIRSD